MTAALKQRIARLEQSLPAPDPKPRDYDGYIRLTKCLDDPYHARMECLFMPNGEWNKDPSKNVPIPDHCLNREQYDALVWSSAEQCQKWILDRCSGINDTGVSIFMDNRVSTPTMTVEEQRAALATTFDGFDLSQIEVNADMLTTDFVVMVIDAVSGFRTKRRKEEKARRHAEFQDWLQHRQGENPLHREANERARLHRLNNEHAFD